MKTYNDIRLNKIKTTKQIFEFKAFNERERVISISDEKDKIYHCILMDENAENLSKMIQEKTLKRGCEISVLITKGKNRQYQKRIVSHLLEFKEPIQSDIEHFVEIKS